MAAIGLVTNSALAQTITDGDTLKLNGKVYRVWGIDAPETKQECPDGWAAGRMATTKLLQLIQGKTVICEKKDTDRYGPRSPSAGLRARHLGSIMVREGMA